MGQARTVVTPPAPRRAQPKAAPKKKAMAQKATKKPPVLRTGMGLKAVFNPTNKVVPPLLVPQLGVFPIQGTIRKEPVQALLTSYFLILSAVPGRSTVAVYGSYPSGGGASIPYTATPFEIWSLPLLALSGHQGGATSSRMTKAGVRVTNASANLYLGGRLYVSHLDQRMKFPADPSLMTASQWVSTFDTVRSLPEPMTKPHSWKDYGSRSALEDKSQYIHVVDEVKYAEYSVHSGPCPAPLDFFDHVGVWDTSADQQRPMSTIVFSWTAPPATTFLQDLTFNVDAQFLTRWPVDTVPGQSAITVAAAPQKVVTDTR